MYKIYTFSPLYVLGGESVSYRKGLEMAKKRYYDKMREATEGGMIAGPVGQAMMPQNVIMKNYPKDGSYLPEDINDGLTGIDKQISAAKSDIKKQLSPTKY